MIDQLIGIYNAKGSIAGELAYLFGKLRGTAQCALCDISHGPLKEKSAFLAALALISFSENTSSTAITDFSNNKAFIDSGYIATIKKIGEIKKKINHFFLYLILISAMSLKSRRIINNIL